MLKSSKIIGYVLIIVLITAGLTSPSFSFGNHFGIAKSTPEENAVIQSVSIVEIWFTQIPQENSMSIRLVDSNGSLISDAIFDNKSEDPRVFTATLDRNLNASEYQIVWRGIGQDGHVVRGGYSFTVSAE